MPKLTQGPPKNNSPVSIEPYQELMMKTLVYALAELPDAWSVWLILDRDGRYYLAEEGLSREDLKQAINAGVRSGLILRKLIHGRPAIALKRLVQP